MNKYKLHVSFNMAVEICTVTDRCEIKSAEDNLKTGCGGLEEKEIMGRKFA
jgi:hypothetical protein